MYPPENQQFPLSHLRKRKIIFKSSFQNGISISSKYAKTHLHALTTVYLSILHAVLIMKHVQVNAGILNPGDASIQPWLIHIPTKWVNLGNLNRKKTNIAKLKHHPPSNFEFHYENSTRILSDSFSHKGSQASIPPFRNQRAHLPLEVNHHGISGGTWNIQTWWTIWTLNIQPFKNTLSRAQAAWKINQSINQINQSNKSTYWTIYVIFLIIYTAI